MKKTIEQLSWPYSNLAEAIERLGKESGLTLHKVDIPIPDRKILLSPDTLDTWIESCGATLGVTVESFPLSYPEVFDRLRSERFLLCRLPGGREDRFVAIVRAKGRRVIVVGPDRALHSVPFADLRNALCAEAEAPLRKETERILERANVPPGRRNRGAQRMIEHRLYNYSMRGWWRIEAHPQHRFRHRLRLRRTAKSIRLLLGIHVAAVLLQLTSWWLLGNGALSGRLEPGWLIAWGLLLATLIPLRTAEMWIQGKLFLALGGALKERLLTGALTMRGDTIRGEGYGRLLGRVHESEAIESLAFGGGIAAATAAVELLIAVGILVAGAGGIVHALLLLCWIVLTGFLLRNYYRRLRAWTEARLAITHHLVEQMTGHRTRLAQERPEDRHRSEDQLTEHYLERSQAMDRAQILLETLGTRGWLVAGIIGLAPAFVAGSDPASLAVGIGGVLLARAALSTLQGGAAQLAGAGISWEGIAPLFKAASHAQEPAHPHLLTLPVTPLQAEPSESEPDKRRSVIEGRNLSYRYRKEGEPVLHECSIVVAPGERVLLEGTSGGGKSTLAALLTGLRLPESGLLLINGLDRATLGEEGWRKRITAAPQFHENHVLLGTFAFNLLMGRRWPPTQEDLHEATEICRGLGLGDLLDRMPGGITQMVGETGWQLSHGEQSRLFIARGLLQRADVIVLDESFGALDPETLRTVVDYVTERGPTLLAIAHP